MELKTFTATDNRGNVISTASVFVYTPNTTTLVSGLLDKDGGSLTNPFSSSVAGLIQFALPAGQYDLRIVAGGRDYTQRVYFLDTTAVEPDVITFYHGYVGGNQEASFADTNTAYGDGALENSATPSGPDDNYESIYNTAFGTNALKNTTLGTESTAIGYGALENSLEYTYGDAFGAFSLYSTTTGYANFAFGSYAMYDNTTGHNNVSIGGGSLARNTIGSDNVSVGQFSGNAITGGTQNITVGNYACNSNSGQILERNTFIGHRSASTPNSNAYDNIGLGWESTYNISGTNNIGVGSASLRNGYAFGPHATTDNIGVGSNTLYNLNSGYNNVAIGSESQKGTGFSTSATPNSNTSVGYYSLRNNSTGNFNSTIGSGGLQAVTSGSNNFSIGYNAGNDAVRTITTNSNEGVLGNNSTTAIYAKVATTVTSDIRDKTEISEVPHGLDFVKSINPISYKFKTSREDVTPTGRVHYGFSAQEILLLQNHEAIVDASDPENLKLNSQDMIAVLVNSIKELSEIVENLKEEIKVLQSNG